MLSSHIVLHSSHNGTLAPKPAHVQNTGTGGQRCRETQWHSRLSSCRHRRYGSLAGHTAHWHAHHAPSLKPTATGPPTSGQSGSRTSKESCQTAGCRTRTGFWQRRCAPPEQVSLSRLLVSWDIPRPPLPTPCTLQCETASQCRRARQSKLQKHRDARSTDTGHKRRRCTGHKRRHGEQS